MGRIRGTPRVLIIRMRHVPAIDSTGIHVLRELAQRSKRDGTLLLLADVHAQPMFALARANVLELIGEENTYGNLDDALNRARTELGYATEERPVFATPTVARESGEHPTIGS